MGSIPSSPREEVLAWCEAHVEIFRTQYAGVGITADQGLDFATAVTTFATSFAEEEKARLAWEAAREASRGTYRIMRRQMTQIVSDVRYYAEDQANPSSVYELAQVPPRQNPSTLPPPGQPTNLQASIVTATGAVELRWRSNNPTGTSGTSYIITRKLPTESEFRFVGVTGERRFVDNTFIAGPDSVQYRVQGQRADSASPVSEIFTLRFGRTGPGRAVTIESAQTGEASPVQAKHAA